MLKTHEEVAAAALAMPIEARAELADRLLSSIDAPDQASIDAAWGAEAERRIDQLDRGEVSLIPGDDLMAELRKRVK